MAAKTVSVEAAIEELTGPMRENGDADYELSLSDSEEETSANDMNHQTIKQDQRIMLLPAMQRQQLLNKLQHLVFLPCYVLQALLNFQGNGQSIVIRLPIRERSGPKVPILTVIQNQSSLNIESRMHGMLKNV